MGWVLTDEQNDVFSPLDCGQGTHDPIGNSPGAIVVGQSGDVVSRFIEVKSTVGLRGHINDSGRSCVLCKEILIPGEGPSLNGWFRNTKERGRRYGGTASFLDGEGEVGVGNSAVGYDEASVSQLKRVFQILTWYMPSEPFTGA